MNKSLKLSSIAMMGLLVVGASGCSNPADVTLWTGFGAAYTTVLETILDGYAGSAGVTVGHESKGGYDNLQTAINNAVATATYPNMANGYPDHFAGYITSQIMLEMDDYIADYDAANGGSLLDDYYEQYLVENQTLYYKADGTGATMGLPFNKSTEVIVYNTDMLDYVRSVDSSISETIPATWDGIREFGAKVLDVIEGRTGSNGSCYGKVIGSDNKLYSTTEEAEAAGATVKVYMRDVAADSFRVATWDSTENMFITLCRQWGATYTEVVSKSNPIKGYARFASGDNKAKTLEMMTYWKTMYDERVFGLASDVGSTTDYASSSFQLGHCLMTIGSSGGLSYNLGTYSNIGVAPMAYKDASAKYVISQGTSLGLFDQGSSEDIQKSFDAIVYLTTGEAQGQWAAETGYYPASKSATNSTAYQTFLNQDPAELNAQQKIYQSSAQLNENYYMNDSEGWVKFTDPGFVGSSSIREQVGYIMAKVFVGEKTNEVILQEAYNAIPNYVES